MRLPAARAEFTQVGVEPDGASIENRGTLPRAVPRDNSGTGRNGRHGQTTATAGRAAGRAVHGNPMALTALQFVRLTGVLLLLGACPLPAIDRDRRMDQLYHTRWGLQEGAPAEIHALAQTADGFLWLGAADGLFRFDGVHFEAFVPRDGGRQLRRNIFSMLATPDGGLWVGFWSGGACFLKDGAARMYDEKEGLPAYAVLAFLVDHQGVTWAAAGRYGLFRLEGGRWRPAGADWGFEGTASSLLEDRAGRIWAGTNDRLYMLPKGARRFQVAAKGLVYVMKLAQAPDGTIWMAETGRGVRPVPGTGHGEEVEGGSQAILVDRQGSLWVATLGSGVRRLADPGKWDSRTIEYGHAPVEDFQEAQGLSSNYMFSILEDREGNIWTGTNVGLDQFRQSPVVSVPLPLSATVSGLAPAAGGGIWAGVVLNQPLFRILRSGVSAPDPRIFHIRSLWRTHDGALWAATPYQLFHMTPSAGRPFAASAIRAEDSVLAAGPAPPRLAYGPGWTLEEAQPSPSSALGVSPDHPVQALNEDSTGRLWVAVSGKGTFRKDHAAWTSLQALGGPAESAPVLHAASDGGMWFGYRKGQVAELRDERVRMLGPKDGVVVGDVLSLGGNGADVWMGGEEGLELWSGGQGHVVACQDRVALQRVTAVLATEGDGLWMAERRGIVHIPEDEVANFRKDPRHPVQIEVFALLDGQSAGLQRSFVSPSAVRADNGVLWFATTGGVAWVDPKRLSRNPVPPLVSITEVTARGRSYETWASPELPALPGTIQIAYTGLSLTIPARVGFRYRLDEVDDDWQEVGGRREAIYTGLGPGRYRFEVMAANNSGVWSKEAAVLEFRIAPAWFQTWWFRTLCGLALACLTWTAYRLRIRQVTTAVQARMGERLAERERIARELHDTLLQGVQGLVLHFEAIRKRIPPDQPAHGMVTQTLQMADQVLVEGRDRVRNLRQGERAACELSEALAAVGCELSVGQSTAFQATVTGTPLRLNPVVRDEVYWVGREALANAFHHAGASRIETEVQYGAHGLRMIVRDDGSGLDEQRLRSEKPGHWGLRGMQERAASIGGKLAFWSRAGAGTEVELTVPARLAYAEEPKAPRWKIWRKR